MVIVPALVLSCVGLTFAQAKSCAVAMRVVNSQVDESITGATATAVNLKTKKSYKSVLKEGRPHFVRLSTGDYRVTVFKPKFMRSEYTFSLTCQDDFWEMPMYLGSPKETVAVRIPTGGYTGTNPFPEAQTGDRNPRAVIENKSVPEKIEEPPVPPKSEPKPLPEIVSVGVLNGRTTYFAKPEYPAAARAINASGQVTVMVVIDKDGTVISASAGSGHPLLRQAAESASKLSRFKETLISGQLVKVRGVLIFNFVP